MAKKKKCKVCEIEFIPKYSTAQVVCSYFCSAVYAQRQREKKEEKEWKEKKKKWKKDLMTLQDYIKICQTHFNAYIRERDKGKNCISCGKPLGKRFDAGHFHSAGGHWNVRFNEDNVHGQHSRPCNKDLHGDLINYRKGLIERIGEERVLELDRLANETAKFTIEEVEEITEIYKKKLRELKNK